MSQHRHVRSAMGWMAGAAGLAIGGYAAMAGRSWWQYGRPSPPPRHERDDLLDLVMPIYDVVERHRIFVRAPAASTLEAAKEQDLFGSSIVRAVFRTRALVMGGDLDDRRRPRPLLRETLALGWRVLDEIPGREVVVGAVTKPWEPNVVFRPIPGDRFAAFAEPDYVKIVWSLRADPVGDRQSIFRTETRAIATDPAARSRFRRYWSLVSPGIALIRQMSLGPVKADAERRARLVHATA